MSTADIDTLTSAQAYVEMLATPISTGWPELDRTTGGLRRPSVIEVIGARSARRTLLSRMSAWAAGDGYSVVHVDDHRSSFALAALVPAAGRSEGPAPDDRTVARLRLTTLGADDLGTVRQVIGQRRPLDLLVLDGYHEEHPDQLAHALGTVVVLGHSERSERELESEATAWWVRRVPDGRLEVRIVELRDAGRDVAADEACDYTQVVHLQVPPRSRTPDLVRRAGRANLFSRAPKTLPVPP